MQCAQCNARLSSTDQFCPGCGASHVAASEASVKFCPECGATLVQDKNYVVVAATNSSEALF